MSKDITLEDLAQMVAEGFQEVNQKLDSLAERFSLLEDRLGRVESRLGRVEDRLSDVVERLDAEQRFTSALRDEFESRVAALEAKLP